MSTRSTRRRNARLSTGALALALLSPVADPSLARADDLGEEQESESEGGNEVNPDSDQGPGIEDLTPGHDTTGDVAEEDSPALVSPGDPTNPEDGEDENGPVEVAPPPDPDDVAPLAGPQPPPPTQPAPAPRGPGPAAPVVPSEGPGAAPIPAPRAQAAPVREKRESAAPARPKRTRERSAAPRHHAAQRLSRATPAPRPSATSASPAPADPSRSAAQDSHIVRAGETLWSIASARLGPGAAPAQIAREVQRIWDLNARAIGTGDPSLIGVGVRLRLA